MPSTFAAMLRQAIAASRPVETWRQGRGTVVCAAGLHAFNPDDMPRLYRDVRACDCAGGGVHASH